MRLTTTLILLFALTACGTRGPLELPPGPPPAPLFGKAPAGTNSSGQQQNMQTQQPDHSNKPLSQ